jgi:hypothetical protein
VCVYNRTITDFLEINIDFAQIRIMYQIGCTPLYRFRNQGYKSKLEHVKVTAFLLSRNKKTDTPVVGVSKESRIL